MKKEHVEIEEIKKILTNYDVRPSFQRLKVYEYFILNRNHPTAEMIFQGLKDIIPSLSRTTIYNTLKLFTQKKLIQAIPLDSNTIRYDINHDGHAHAKCIICGEIFDIKIKADDIQHTLPDSFEIKEFDVIIRGCCKKCKK